MILLYYINDYPVKMYKILWGENWPRATIGTLET